MSNEKIMSEIADDEPLTPYFHDIELDGVNYGYHLPPIEVLREALAKNPDAVITYTDGVTPRKNTEKVADVIRQFEEED